MLLHRISYEIYASAVLFLSRTTTTTTPLPRRHIEVIFNRFYVYKRLCLSFIIIFHLSNEENYALGRYFVMHIQYHTAYTKAEKKMETKNSK